MAEFFQSSVVGFLLRAVDAFPVDRDRANRQTIRTAIERLKDGRVVGLFPEGGIRDGARSLLEGAPLRPGASTLAHISRRSDFAVRYSRHRSSLFSKIPKAFATATHASLDRLWKSNFTFPGLEKSEARARIESELASSFKSLYAELQQTFHLTGMICRTHHENE